MAGQTRRKTEDEEKEKVTERAGRQREGGERERSKGKTDGEGERGVGRKRE